MNLVFCKLKKTQKHECHFFVSFKKLIKHDFDTCKLKIETLKTSKNMNLILASLKTSKNMNFTFCKLKS